MLSAKHFEFCLQCLLFSVNGLNPIKQVFPHRVPPPTLSLPYFTILLPWLYNHFPWHSRPQKSVSGTLDRPRVVAPTKTCGHVRSSRRRWRWAQCLPRSAAPTFGKVVLAGDSTPAWCPVYHLCERPQPGVVRSGLVSLQVVATRDQKWRVASDKSGLLSLLRQFGKNGLTKFSYFLWLGGGHFTRWQTNF